MDKGEVNRRVFGHDTFRPGQEVLIDAILSGRDCLGVMPTGGGKSLCYELPALLLPGLTLVISPLISLMKDQVAALEEMGVAAACWNSAMTDSELSRVREGVERGLYRLLYVAPERLDSERFTAMMERAGVSLVAVDEAHCLSQWGQDFRPSYLKIPRFISRLPHRPVVAAFTATATPAVRRDIQQQLELREPETVVTGFDRPNLFFDVREPKRKLDAVKALVEERLGRCGIIYCATRKGVEEVWAALAEAGVPAGRYHAGMEPEERRESQEDFQFDRKTVMVATNAFGMGIDKSNVSYVIHYNMPMSLEAYYQEAGRAGRDGSPADCILLFSPQDIRTAQYLIAHREEKEELTPERREELRRRDGVLLERMIGYCKTCSCYRGYLMAYFGQEYSGRCENCGNCASEFTLRDVTVEAQMILSCVRRVTDRLRYAVGPALIVKVLRGSRAGRVTALGLDKLSTYGLMAQLPQRKVSALVDALTEQGYMEREEEHGTLRLTARARDVLFRGQRVEIPVKRVPKPVRRRSAGEELGEERGLYEALAALRLRLAREMGVPAYVVFSNAALRDMAQRAPTTRSGFLEVNGVGEKKAARYADAFLREIRRWRERHENGGKRDEKV